MKSYSNDPPRLCKFIFTKSLGFEWDPRLGWMMMLVWRSGLGWLVQMIRRLPAARSCRGTQPLSAQIRVFKVNFLLQFCFDFWREFCDLFLSHLRGLTNLL